MKPLKTKQKGVDILHDPLWNKGMAMDYPERDRLNLRGLVPPRVKSLEEQAVRVMAQINDFPDDLEGSVEANKFLQELHSRNETLYHRVLCDNIEVLAPLVYTPTVGHVCEHFGKQFRRARGMSRSPRGKEATEYHSVEKIGLRYFSVRDRGLFSSMVWNWPHDDVHIIARGPGGGRGRVDADADVLWARHVL